MLCQHWEALLILCAEVSEATETVYRKDYKNAMKALQVNGMCHETQGHIIHIKYQFPLCLLVYFSYSVLLSIFY